MGAHTLGGAVASESGYMFDNTATPNSFTNAFYSVSGVSLGRVESLCLAHAQDLLTRGWRQVTLVAPGSPVGAVTQWIRVRHMTSAGLATCLRAQQDPAPVGAPQPQYRMFDTDM
jgi:hypothetical protein